MEFVANPLTQDPFINRQLVLMGSFKDIGNTN